VKPFSLSEEMINSVTRMLQPDKPEAALGVVVSTSGDALTKLDEHDEPHLMPAQLLVSVPQPLPSISHDSFGREHSKSSLINPHHVLSYKAGSWYGTWVT
jgi:hypothetical protein